MSRKLLSQSTFSPYRPVPQAGGRDAVRYVLLALVHALGTGRA
jgi:hypothetical protein